VNAPGYPGPTPLMQAVYFGLTDFVKLLLEAGADPNIPNQVKCISVFISLFTILYALRFTILALFSLHLIQGRI
jgi:ankyrin repeat protein